MELIERYLQAVKFALPDSESDDIIKELRDSIFSQMEEKESTLGRPLNEDEVSELLKKMGSPMQLASRYRKPRQLIGPVIFPIYWKVLQMALGVALLVHVVVSIGMSAAGKTFSESLGMLWHFPFAAVVVFSWVTLVFAAMEYFGGKCNIPALNIGDRWDPRTLPLLTKDKPRKSRFELIAEFVLQTFFGMWWLAGLHYQYLILGPGYDFVRFGPVWHTIYPLFVGMVVIDLTLTAIRIARPQWSQGGRIKGLVMAGLGLVVLYFLLRAPELLVAADPSSLQSQNLARTLNSVARMGLTVAAVVNVLTVLGMAAKSTWRKLEHGGRAVFGL